MSENVTQETKQLQFCWRCGRILYVNTKNGRIGCRNTKCRGYLMGSKHLGDDVLKQFRR